MKNSLKSYMKVFIPLLIYIMLFAQSVSAGIDNAGAGILHIHSQSPMQSLRMVMPLMSAGSVVSGWGTSLSGTWTNVWSNNSDYSLDYEMLAGRATIAYGVNDRFGISLSFDKRKYIGGSMDGFIEGFHDSFGIKQEGRALAARGESRVVRIGSSTGAEKADIFDNSGVTFSLSYDLMDGDDVFPAVNLAAAVRYGTNTGEFFSDDHPIDYGFSVALAKRWTKKFYSHVILSYTIFDVTRSQDVPGFIPVILETQQFSGLFSLGFECSDRLTIVGQYLFNEAAVKNISGLNKPSHEVHLGLKYRTESAGIFEFGLIENVVNFDNSPDFGIHLGWSYHF